MIPITKTVVPTSSHAGTCPHCHFLFPPIWEATPLYFERGYVTCSKCKQEADLWTAVLATTQIEHPVPQLSLVRLGATNTIFECEIAANKHHEVRLADAGIPEEATVLQVGYSAKGGPDGIVFPFETHLNVPQRRRIGNVLHLIGQAATEGDGTIGTKNPVGIWVVWVHQDSHDSWPYILHAFQEYVDGHYDRLIIPAQSAVEISLMPLIRELFVRHASAGKVKAFVGDRLSFSNAVDVILPFVSGQAGIAKLPEPIGLALAKLRGLRNRIAHQGHGGSKITSKEAGEGLCAAVFTFEYVKYARPKLLAWLK